MTIGTEKDILISGVDAGNNKTKISYINNKGTIDSTAITTIYAVTQDSSSQDLGSGALQQKEIEPEQRIHIQINSKALSDNFKNSYLYVGDYAQDKPGRVEPSTETEDKTSSDLIIITTLTSLALAAWKLNKSEEVNIPLSIGLPINEYKKTKGANLIDKYLGKHTIEALDGPFKNKKVTLNITSVRVNIEGIHSYLALAFTLKNGKMAQTSIAKRINPESFALTDLGAGTEDYAIYDKNGLNSVLSKNIKKGTNKQIQLMMEEIAEMEQFSRARSRFKGENPLPARTREEFIREYIKPEIDKMLNDDSYEPKFKVRWMMDVNEKEVTEVIKKHMKLYADRVLEEIDKVWADSNVSSYVLVGGGLLFGYLYLREQRDVIIFPDDLEESPFLTSKAYLLQNYSEILATQEA